MVMIICSVKVFFPLAVRIFWGFFKVLVKLPTLKLQGYFSALKWLFLFLCSYTFANEYFSDAGAKQKNWRGNIIKLVDALHAFPFFFFFNFYRQDLALSSAWHSVLETSSLTLIQESCLYRQRFLPTPDRSLHLLFILSVVLSCNV